MKLIVIEKFGGSPSIVTDENGNVKEFESWGEAFNEVDSCQQGIAVDLDGGASPYETARNYLCDTELDIEEQVELIAKAQEDGRGDEYIDNVEGVLVWEKVVHQFEVDEFLQLINY